MRAALLLVLFGTGCGYSMATRAPSGRAYPIAVAPVREPALDVDAGSEVQRAVQTSVARSAGLALVEPNDDAYLLRVEVLDVTTNLAPFAEPNVRAGQYIVRLSLRVTIEHLGAPIWQSGVINGQGRFLSTPGAVERLDGDGRRTLQRAAIDAADRLVLAVRAALDDRSL